MKRLLICILLTLGMIMLSQQKAVAQGGNYGVEAGVNLANVNGSDIDSDIRAGLFFGFYYRFMLASGPFHVQPELLYSQKGYKFNDFTIALDYINLNILLSYYLANMGPVKPFIKGGPYLAYNISAKEKFEGEENDIDDFVKSTDAGVMLRAGVQTARIEAGLRLAQGITTVFDNEISDEKNFLIGFFIGFNIN